MFNLQALSLMHRHGDAWAEMREVAPLGPDSHDPERELLRGGRVFRCDECDEEILVVPSGEAA